MWWRPNPSWCGHSSCYATPGWSFLGVALQWSARRIQLQNFGGLETVSHLTVLDTIPILVFLSRLFINNETRFAMQHKTISQLHLKTGVLENPIWVFKFSVLENFQSSQLQNFSQTALHGSTSGSTTAANCSKCFPPRGSAPFRLRGRPGPGSWRPMSGEEELLVVMMFSVLRMMWKNRKNDSHKKQF